MDGFAFPLKNQKSLETLCQVAMDQEVKFSEIFSEQVVWKQGRQDSWEAVSQLVVPEKYRKRLMEWAHEIPCTEQLGINRPQLQLNSYWSKLAQDVRDCCRPDVPCQRVSKSGDTVRAPLQSLPIMGEFGRNVRGQLDLGREKREEKVPEAEKPVVGCVMYFKEWLKRMVSVVGENLAKDTVNQSSWYDKTARSLTFELGGKVRVFSAFPQWQVYCSHRANKRSRRGPQHNIHKSQCTYTFGIKTGHSFSCLKIKKHW